MKGREAADNQLQRDKIWNWYFGDLERRLRVDGAVILIQCMTGDTQVLMADGTERPLRVRYSSPAMRSPPMTPAN